jgi:hypothetical protein
VLLSQCEAGIGAKLSNVDRKDYAASTLDPLGYFALNRQRSEETVEIRDNDHINVAALNEMDRVAQFGRGRARHHPRRRAPPRCR